ncbi:MAG: aminoacyl-tRNA hydrolase [Pseudomonadota bacterium]
MFILVGLGNPGGQYALHRHNVGFMVIDAIAEAYGAPSFRKKFQAEVSECKIDGTKVLLMKPQTFMNESGQAVQAAAQFYKIAPADIMVVHDELDLEPFKLKVKVGGGTAGHNGLKSIQAHLGTPDFGRLRFGIGHPGAKPLVLKYVLGNFAKAEMDPLADYLGAIAAEIGLLAKGETAPFLSNIARRLR